MAIDAPTVAINVPLVGDERRKNWAKIIYEVDESKSSGWAFVGDFIASGGIQDVPAGSVIVVYGERGSRTNPQIEAKAYVANPDATLSQIATAKGRAWARTLRDPVAEALRAEKPTHKEWVSDLGLFSSEALAKELTRRGWSLTPPKET